jgi:CBS domain-containing protein
MSVGRICAREVDVAEEHESIQTAAQRMHARNVGTLVVINEEQEPIGIVTDRDLVVKALARGLDPNEGIVTEAMTPCPVTVYEETPIEDALRIMRSGACRRVPVVDREGKLLGLLSLDDVLSLLAEEFREIGELLNKEGPRVFSRP